MKKIGKKAAAHREWQILNMGLNENQLRVIRKLVKPADLQEIGASSCNRRTAEAVLQGRRNNVGILSSALNMARERLVKINKEMQELEAYLSSDLTTRQENFKILNKAWNE